MTSGPFPLGELMETYDSHLQTRIAKGVGLIKPKQIPTKRLDFA